MNPSTSDPSIDALISDVCGSEIARPGIRQTDHSTVLTWNHGLNRLVMDVMDDGGDGHVVVHVSQSIVYGGARVFDTSVRDAVARSRQIMLTWQA